MVRDHGWQNVAEIKPHKGKADCGFSQPKMPEQGGEQLPFVMRSVGTHNSPIS